MDSANDHERPPNHYCTCCDGRSTRIPRRNQAIYHSSPMTRNLLKRSTKNFTTKTPNHPHTDVGECPARVHENGPCRSLPLTPNALDSTCTPCNWRAASLALKNERHPYLSPGRKRKLPLLPQARQQPKKEAPPPLLPQNEKSAEPEKVKKARSTSLGAQAATTTMVTTSSNENTPSVSAHLHRQHPKTTTT
jgi:hypothetical protein